MVSLAHVCIESTDLEATERFYGAIGLNRLFDFRNTKGDLIGFFLKFENQSFIEVVRVKEITPQARFRHFAIETEDIELERSRLREAGFEVGEKTMGKDGSWMMKCNDPSGILLEFHQYTPSSLQKCGGVCTIDYDPDAT